MSPNSGSNSSTNLSAPHSLHHKKSKSILGGVASGVASAASNVVNALVSSGHGHNAEEPLVKQTSSLKLSHPPTLKGHLQKWTNYASGYKHRFFVLENGVLSYYRSESEFPHHCKGSLRADIIDVKPDHSDKSRFEVFTKGVKFQLKASSQEEAKHWMWALVESRQYVIDKSRDACGVLEGKHPAFTDSDSESESSAANAVAKDPSSRTVGPGEKQIATGHADSITVEFKNALQALRDSVNALGLAEDGTNSLLDQVTRLSNLYDKRELKWFKQIERRRQWEALVKSIVDLGISGNKSEKLPVAASSDVISNDASAQSGSVGNLGMTESMRDDDGSDNFSSGNEEEFFDAENETTPAIEELLGFETFNDDDGPADDAQALTGRETGMTVNMEFSDTASAESPDDVVLLSSTTRDGQTFTRRKRLRSIIGPQIFSALLPETLCGKYRSVLPLPANAKKPSLSVWGFLKSAIGKDLSKVTLPVFFNEPLTMLQRFAEEMEYSPLLSLAGRLGCSSARFIQNDPAWRTATQLGWDLSKIYTLTAEQVRHARLLLVAAFAMSNYAGTVGRNNKPFNPMLGETFELVSRDNQFRYLSEQVCHHPPISAAFAESPDFVFWGEVNVKSKFWGKSLEIHPLGNNHARLPIFDEAGNAIGTEHYSWKKVTTTVNGLITGRLWIANTGDMVVTNHRTGEEVVLTFKKKEGGGWFSSSSGVPEADGSSDRELVGKLFSKTHEPLYSLSGRWDQFLQARPVDVASSARTGLCSVFSTPLNLWRVNPLPAHAEDQFQFTSFAVALNDIPSYLDKILPPTDSRRRADCRAMEEGRWEDADSAKVQLETIQRNRRKLIQAKFEDSGQASAPPPDYLGGIAGNDTGRAAAAMQTLSRSRDPLKSSLRATQLQALDIGENWWQPRWFVREKDADTGDEHWRFTREYWTFRGENLTQEAALSYTPEWPKWVCPIFSEPQPGEI